MVKPHILVVDDDVYIVETLTSFLEIQGCRVTAAYGCKQAMDRLRTQDKVDLIILDYFMPDGSGTDLLRTLGEEKSIQRPPVIMSSGIIDNNTPVWEKLRKQLPPASQALIQAYVNKPYRLDAMDIAVHEVLGGDYIPGPRLNRKIEKLIRPQ